MLGAFGVWMISEGEGLGGRMIGWLDDVVLMVEGRGKLRGYKFL